VNKCANEISFAFGKSKRVPTCVVSNESKFSVNRGQKFVSIFLNFDEMVVYRPSLFSW